MPWQLRVHLPLCVPVDRYSRVPLKGETTDVSKLISFGSAEACGS